MTRILILLLISCSCFAQGGIKEVSLIKCEMDFFTADNQGNVYVVKEDELRKFSKEGKELYKYSNKKFGKITSVDASNMMRVLVYYREFSQVVFLDNTLSANGEALSFDKLGFQNVSLVANSYAGMWIYDQQNTSLLQLSTTYEVKHQTENLSVLLNTSMQPTALLEYNNRIYLNNPAAGIMVFDIYGTYYKTVPAKNITSFQPLGDKIYYLQDDKMFSYHLQSSEVLSDELGVKDVRAFCVAGGSLIVQTGEGISVLTQQ